MYEESNVKARVWLNQISTDPKKSIPVKIEHCALCFFQTQLEAGVTWYKRALVCLHTATHRLVFSPVWVYLSVVKRVKRNLKFTNHNIIFKIYMYNSWIYRYKIISTSVTS